MKLIKLDKAKGRMRAIKVGIDKIKGRQQASVHAKLEGTDSTHKKGT